MATLQSIDLDLSNPDISSQPIYRRLGLLNGLLIGLALAVGAWGLETLRVIQLPFRLYLPTLLLGMAFIVLLSTLVGWLTSRFAKAWITVPLWLALATIAILTMGYLGYHGRALVVWLADPRFWGRNIYPYTISGSTAGLLLGGFMIYLIIGLLSLLQSYRLENLAGSLGGRSRLTGRTWLGLLWPLPLVFAAAFFTKNSMFDPAAVAATTTHEAIQVVRAYDGDLNRLGQAEGVNYNALRGVRDQLAGEYTLSLAEINPNNSSVTVAADFDSGSWVFCRFVADQLSHCYDAAPPYTTGLQSLLLGETPPEECRNCLPRLEDEAQAAQLAQIGERMGGVTAVERVAQWGSHVLMRATGPSGQSVDCWYEGITQTYLTECHDTSP